MLDNILYVADNIESIGCCYSLLYCYCYGQVRWAVHVTRKGERRGVYRVLEGKPEGKRLLGRPTRRWEDNIKMDLQKLGCGGRGLDWSDSG